MCFWIILTLELHKVKFANDKSELVWRLSHLEWHFLLHLSSLLYVSMAISMGKYIFIKGWIHKRNCAVMDNTTVHACKRSWVGSGLKNRTIHNKNQALCKVVTQEHKSTWGWRHKETRLQQNKKNRSDMRMRTQQTMIERDWERERELRERERESWDASKGNPNYEKKKSCNRKSKTMMILIKLSLYISTGK